MTDRATQIETVRRLAGLEGAAWERVVSRAEQYFDGFPLAGRRVLDVGAGRGVFSLWMRLVLGAGEVVALEPSLGVGGHDDFAAMLARRFESAGVDGLRVAVNTIQGYPASEGPFDAVVSLNSINHVDEVRISLDPPSPERARFEAIFAKLHDLMGPGGDLLVTDVARHCLERYTSKVGLPRLFTPGIEYDIHQDASTWARLARGAGLVDVRWWGLASRRLAPLGALARHPVVNKLTNANFILRARRA